MSCILHIETTTQVCSVALSQDGACLCEEVKTDGPSHAACLAGFVESVLSFADSHAIPLDAVAVSSGPGSYTGLRIGVSMAKGICYGRSVPLIAVPTLELLCVPVLLRHDDLPEDALLCPMIDARRMEVYSAFYDRSLRTFRAVGADVVAPGTYDNILDVRPVWFFGNGATKCKPVLEHPNAHFIDGIDPMARYMFPLAEKAVALGRYEDVAYFEPFYLKQFVTTKPKDILHGL